MDLLNDLNINPSSELFNHFLALYVFNNRKELNLNINALGDYYNDNGIYRIKDTGEFLTINKVK